jgi:hypothetical protein
VFGFAAIDEVAKDCDSNDNTAKDEGHCGNAAGLGLGFDDADWVSHDACS